jgi:hypothetical protein
MPDISAVLAFAVAMHSDSGGCSVHHHHVSTREKHATLLAITKGDSDLDH